MAPLAVDLLEDLCNIYVMSYQWRETGLMGFYELISLFGGKLYVSKVRLEGGLK